MGYPKWMVYNEKKMDDLGFGKPPNGDFSLESPELPLMLHLPLVISQRRTRDLTSINGALQ